MYKLIVIYHKHVTCMEFHSKEAAEDTREFLLEYCMKDVYCHMLIVKDCLGQ